MGSGHDLLPISFVGDTFRRAWDTSLLPLQSLKFMPDQFLDVVRSRIAELLDRPVSADFEPSFPIGADTVELRRPTRNRLELAYVAIDAWPAEQFWDDAGAKGTFRRFRAEGTRSRHLERLSAAGAVAFDVVLDENGLLTPVHVGSASRSIGVYSLPHFESSAVRSGRMTVEQALQSATRILEAYSAWQEGAICGVVIERYGVDEVTGDLHLLESSPNWCQLGPRAAGALLISALGDEAGVAPRL